MDSWYVAIPVALLLAWIISQRLGKVPPNEAKELVKKGAKLVDVRSPGEFAGGHIEGAINVPVGELERRMNELGPKDAVYVVYCASGMRSARAKGILRAAGRTNVHDLGAMSRW
jgi:rhodanese-related sulfurtransferase